MTAQDATGLIGALGFPIFLIVAMLWIFVRYLWPWFVADQKLRREVESARHSDYIKSVEHSSSSIDILAKTLIELTTYTKDQNDRHSEQAEAQHGVLINVIEKNHTEVVKRLDKIDGKIPNGFGAGRRND